MVCGLTGKLLDKLFSVLTYPCFYQLDHRVMTVCLFHTKPSLGISAFVSHILRNNKRNRQPGHQTSHVRAVRNRHAENIKPASN